MAPKQLFKTPTRPTKKRKISKTPRRTVQPVMQVVQMETKRQDADMGAPVSGYKAVELFNIAEGTLNTERNGNLITAKSIKVKYDLSAGQTTAGTKPSSLLLIRNMDPPTGGGFPPQNKTSWATSLFADPLHDDWSMNLRNIDNTNQYQILRAVHFDPNEFLSGHGPSSKGYFEIKMNQKLKFPISGADKPTNISYFLVYWSGDATNNDTPTVRYRLEWVDN